MVPAIGLTLSLTAINLAATKLSRVDSLERYARYIYPGLGRAGILWENIEPKAE